MHYLNDLVWKVGLFSIYMYSVSNPFKILGQGDFPEVRVGPPHQTRVMTAS